MDEREFFEWALDRGRLMTRDLDSGHLVAVKRRSVTRVSNDPNEWQIPVFVGDRESNLDNYNIYSALLLVQL